MKVLVACEESQRVCIAFRERGHEAYSCDIQDCSGGHPEWHIQDDVLPLLNGRCAFRTVDNVSHTIEGKWDMIIAFPPCTYLTNTGNRWFNTERYGCKAFDRKIKRTEAMKFVWRIAGADCPKIAIENPVGCLSTAWKKPSQIIQPYMFGDKVRKTTCLWLKGLPNLTPTNIVEPEIYKLKNSNKTDSPWHRDTMNLPKEERSRIRSQTYEGMARAFADQWGGDIRNDEIDGVTKWR